MDTLMMRLPLLAVMIATLPWTTGCASSSETAQRDELTANVGMYSPPPAGITKARVGVPPFDVQADRQSFAVGQDQLDRLASDQMTTLLHQSQRFAVIERGQLEQLLREQKLEGIVKPGELARSGQVQGVDYLLIGKVTNFRVKADRQSRGMDVSTGNIFRDRRLSHIGGGFNQEDVSITTDCGVDIRLIDPTSGEVVVAHFGEFKRTDAASALGLSIMSFRSNASADIQIQADDAGKIMRLAFDDALRKMLPEIDSRLQARQQTAAAALPVNQSQAPAVTVEEVGKLPADAGKEIFCSNCGKAMSASAKFCPSCGVKSIAAQ